MASKLSCFCTPPKSPEQVTAIQSTEHVIFSKEKPSGCVYPNYKRKQPNLKIRTTNLSNSKTVARTQATSLYQKINTIPEPKEKVQKVKSNSHTLTPKQYMEEKVMENTNLICSFLKTVCVGLPMDENDYQTYGMPSPGGDEDSGHKKTKYVSLENFVANILNITELTDTSVHGALFFINRYLKFKKEREEKPREIAMASSQNDSISFEFQSKRSVYIPKSIALRMSHSIKPLHSISKSRNKIKLNQQSINYLYQQSKKAKKVEGKKEYKIVVAKPYDFSKSCIKTKKDLIFVALICSSKYLDDNCYSNKSWKKLTDKSIKEVFDLEREFLISLDYKLYFTNEEWKEWYVWLSRFKNILNNSVPTSENKSSPSGMISVPSQPSPSLSPSSSQYTEVVFPSLIELPTPTSANSSSNIPLFSMDEENRKKEKIPLNYLSETNNIFFPPLSVLASCDEYYQYYPHQKRIMQQFYANPYDMPYPKVASHYNYSSYPPYYKERAGPYEMLMSSLEMTNTPCPNLIDTIDTCLISQAQNTQIDFSEIQELSQKQNFIFKKPVLPPEISTPTDTFDVVNMTVKMNGSKPMSTSRPISNYFIPPLY